jgi:hypothetical protein
MIPVNWTRQLGSQTKVGLVAEWSRYDGYLTINTLSIEPEPVAPDSWARGILAVKRFTTSQKANKMRDNLLAPQALGFESSQPSNMTMYDHGFIDIDIALIKIYNRQEGLDAPMPIEPMDSKVWTRLYYHGLH